MSKDYKNINRAKRKNQSAFSAKLQGTMNFLTGLVIGLFIAFIVYLKEHQVTNDQNRVIPDIQITQQGEVSATPDGETVELPEPEFDFYEILPNMELNVSEWVADDTPEQSKTGTTENGIYILQVGSFKDFEAADETKAKLALLGIDADIQRVVINGRDVHHRVRIGPYQEPQKLNQAKQILLENNLEFMLLKLKLDDV